MILSAVNICYDPIHQPFASEGAVKIQNLNSERSALKIIRAVLRDSDIDPEDAVNYSIHRCYCRFKIKIEDDDEEETFNPESTLDELKIKDGDSVFISKRNDAGEEKEEEQGSTLRRSSRKRKETEYKEDDDTGSLESTVTSPSTSGKRRATSRPSNAPAAVDKVSSNLENLLSTAASAARTISKLLGGDDWKTQPIGKLVPIQTKGGNQLLGLCRLVKTSLEVPQLSKSDRNGLFNSDLIEALTRAYYQRVSSSMAGKGQNNFLSLGLPDYERANVLLKGKIKQDGSWERSSISHLDESALSKPSERYPLRDSGLSGHYLNTARDICICWNNEKWIKQAPLPGLSPVSLKDTSKNVILRQIAQLTRVKPGEATPDGFPPKVLRALRQAIQQRTDRSGPAVNGSPYGWKQSKDIAQALELLKRHPKARAAQSASSSGSG